MNLKANQTWFFLQYDSIQIHQILRQKIASKQHTSRKITDDIPLTEIIILTLKTLLMAHNRGCLHAFFRNFQRHVRGWIFTILFVLIFSVMITDDAFFGNLKNVTSKLWSQNLYLGTIDRFCFDQIPPSPIFSLQARRALPLSFLYQVTECVTGNHTMKNQNKYHSEYQPGCQSKLFK